MKTLDEFTATREELEERAARIRRDIEGMERRRKGIDIGIESRQHALRRLEARINHEPEGPRAKIA